MTKRYKIWDKQSTVYTPSGASFTPEEWINQYSWINIPGAVPVGSAGMINGGFIGELGEMRAMYAQQGCVFADGMTNEQTLEAIEAFEDAMNTPPDPADIPPTAEERTAAALEFIAMSSLPDEV